MAQEKRAVSNCPTIVLQQPSTAANNAAEQNAAHQRYVPFNSKHKRSAAASNLTRLPRSCLAASIRSHCHPKPRSECAHLQRLLRDAPLLGGGHSRHRAHVVQPVRQLNHNDADLYRQRWKQSRHEKRRPMQPTSNGTEGARLRPCTAGCHVPDPLTSQFRPPNKP